MDPSACFEDMRDAIECGEYAEARECARNLLEWSKRGGFWPEEVKHGMLVYLIVALLDEHRQWED